MPREVIFAPEAIDDLLEIYDFIANQDIPDVAYGYVERIRAYCLGLNLFPERGRRRDDLRPGLRVIGFERRVMIAFHIAPDSVVIDRIAYGGRDLTGLFQGE